MHPNEKMTKAEREKKGGRGREFGRNGREGGKETETERQRKRKRERERARDSLVSVVRYYVCMLSAHEQKATYGLLYFHMIWSCP